MDDRVALEHKAQAEVAKWQNSAVEDQARIRELEALLKSIRGYMFPGNVMPVPEQAKYIVQWINSALETVAERPAHTIFQGEEIWVYHQGCQCPFCLGETAHRMRLTGGGKHAAPK